MKFLIKIEEAINQNIERILETLKKLTPGIFFEFIHFILHLPALLKKIILSYLPSIRLFFLKFVGYVQHYITTIRGYFISVLMYLRSDEFKKANKKELLLNPIRYLKFHPMRALSGLCLFLALSGAVTLIFHNAQKILLGTSALRKPASIETSEEDIYIEFKSRKFEVKVASAEGGGHGAAANHHEQDLFLDIKIEAKNPVEKEYLEHMEEMLEDNIEAFDFSITQLPLSPENQKLLERTMTKSLNDDFTHIGHEQPIKSIVIKQVLPGRPQYFKQADRMTSFLDINLQIFLEDTHRNRQVWLDFSVLSSNRNVILYLKDHEVELKDHLTTNVEPVLPQLPIEDEGRLIIKDKIRSEIDQFLEKNHIEGKILEVYLDYLLVS